MIIYEKSSRTCRSSPPPHTETPVLLPTPPTPPLLPYFLFDCSHGPPDTTEGVRPSSGPLYGGRGPETVKDRRCSRSKSRTKDSVPTRTPTALLYVLLYYDHFGNCTTICISFTSPLSTVVITTKTTTTLIRSYVRPTPHPGSFNSDLDSGTSDQGRTKPRSQGTGLVKFQLATQSHHSKSLVTRELMVPLTPFSPSIPFPSTRR